MNEIHSEIVSQQQHQHIDQNDVSSNSIQSATKSATENEDYNNSHRPMPTSGKEQWIPRRRRRKDEEINASARSSNSSSGNPGSHHNKISPASPNQPAFSGNNRDATTSGNSGASSGHTINNRPMAQQQFDLAESSFPPLPVLDQNIPTSTAAPTNQNVTNNVSKSTEGTTSDVAIALDATSNKLVSAIVPSTTAWGESRLADVVKGTAKTKSNKADKDVHSDTRSNSASPTPASHQNQQQFHSVGSQKSNENSHTVISVKTLQNLDISLAQRSGAAGGEQQTEGELNVLHGSTVALTPPFSPEQCVAQTATTNNPNNKIKPPVIIKCTTADKSTKTDESLLNGLTTNASSSPSSADNASTIQNQLLNSSFENISVSGGGVATTTSVATMTSMEATYGSSASVAKTSIGLVVSTSTMTTSIPKPHTQQYKQNTSKQPLQQHKSSTNNPSQTQVFISQTHPISPSPTSPGSVHLNENFTSLASPPLTNNAIVEQNVASSSARLSYAQVAQHNRELLSKTAEPQLVQTQQQPDKPEKHVEKDHKRKDFSPPRVSSHGDVRLERAGKT